MRKQSLAAKIAYPALLGALSLIFVYLGSIAPSGKWGLIAVGGLFPAAAVISIGLKSGFLCWAGVSILAIIFIPDKFSALLYCALFGLYPMVKSLVERLRRSALGYVLKLVFFNLAFSLVYIIMREAVLGSLPSALNVGWLIYLIGNVVFLIYDFGFSKLISFYIARIGRAVR